MNLELMALSWLRWEKRCSIVLSERSPREAWCGRPDALGVMASRHLVEIEIKRTLSDFKADQKKPSRNEVRRNFMADKLPMYFYYLVPPDLVKRVELLVPTWAGLMRGPEYGEPQGIRVVKQAPKNKEAKRLTVRECCRLVLMVNNHALSELSRVEASRNGFVYGHYDWEEYQI